MDFGKLLNVAAKQNSHENNQVRCYSTKFAPPKKESKDKALSSGIKRFLAKKEEEDREKERQLRENRERLQAMRDNKSKNKINKMLKVIKSANKSVIHESTDPSSSSSSSQVPEEDDFGYVSHESSAIYNRLMEKYKDTEESPQKERRPRPVETAKPVSVRKETSRGASSTSGGKTGKHSGTAKPDPPKANGAAPVPAKKPVVRKPPPPSVANFEELLKLAEKKQFEPIKVEQADKGRKEERPMTQKEKREFEERQRMAQARKKRLESDNYDYRKVEPKEAPKTTEQKKEKENPSNGTQKPRPTYQSNLGKAQATHPPPPGRPGAPSAREQPRSSTNYQPSPSTSSGKTRQFPPPDVQKTRAFPPEDVARRPQSRPFPPADVRRKPHPVSSGPSRDFKRGRYEEDEEPEEDDYEDEDDYDSEMDDFIDDGPLNQSDVSACIKEIFGYDKSRYRDEDYDDREMESSFAQQMREESYSRKVGRLEDEADMRQEALDKARKAALKRAAKRS